MYQVFKSNDWEFIREETEDQIKYQVYRSKTARTDVEIKIRVMLDNEDDELDQFKTSVQKILIRDRLRTVSDLFSEEPVLPRNPIDEIGIKKSIYSILSHCKTVGEKVRYLTQRRTELGKQLEQIEQALTNGIYSQNDYVWRKGVMEAELRLINAELD